MVAMTGGVAASRGSGEAALQLAPAAVDVVSAPDAVVPADVHDAQPHGVAVRIALAVGPEQPGQERLGIRALLGIAHRRHPVESTSFLVLAGVADVARTRDPHRLVGAVGRLDEVGEGLRSGLGGGIALRLALVQRRQVVGRRHPASDVGDGGRGQAGAGHGRTGGFAGPVRRGPGVGKSGGRQDNDRQECSHRRGDGHMPATAEGGGTEQGSAPRSAGKHVPTLT